MTGILWNPTTHQTIEKFPNAFLCNLCSWAHRTGIWLAQQILGQLEQIPSRSTSLFVLGRFLVSTRLVKWAYRGIGSADAFQSSRGRGGSMYRTSIATLRSRKWFYYPSPPAYPIVEPRQPSRGDWTKSETRRFAQPRSGMWAAYPLARASWYFRSGTCLCCVLSQERPILLLSLLLFQLPWDCSLSNFRPWKVEAPQSTAQGLKPPNPDFFILLPNGRLALKVY